MFRFFSCKFIEKSKLRAARVVLFKEFGIMNCFTLEASFHGFMDKDRTTTELTIEDLEDMGKTLGCGFHEYGELVDEDARQKYNIKMQIKNSKKRKIKASDITKALISRQVKKIDANLNASDAESEGYNTRSNFHKAGTTRDSAGSGKNGPKNAMRSSSTNMAQS